MIKKVFLLMATTLLPYESTAQDSGILSCSVPQYHIRSELESEGNIVPVAPAHNLINTVKNEGIKFQPNGEYPGEYVAIIRDHNNVAVPYSYTRQTRGADFMIPCGENTSCSKPWFKSSNTADSIVVLYFPCFTGNRQQDRNIGRLQPYASIIPECSDAHNPSINSEDMLSQFETGVSGCSPIYDQNGRIGYVSLFTLRRTDLR